MKSKFKFSIRRLIVITTVVAILLGIAERLDLFGQSNMYLAGLGIYCLMLLGYFALAARRYVRDWETFKSGQQKSSEVRRVLQEEVARKRESRER